jgi:hypothetical protein
VIAIGSCGSEATGCTADDVKLVDSVACIDFARKELQGLCIAIPAIVDVGTPTASKVM